MSKNRLRNHAKTHKKEQDDVVKTIQSKDRDEDTSSLCYIIFDVVELAVRLVNSFSQLLGRHGSFLGSVLHTYT